VVNDRGVLEVVWWFVVRGGEGSSGGREVGWVG
jgi:hypothetical protein